MKKGRRNEIRCIEERERLEGNTKEREREIKKEKSKMKLGMSGVAMSDWFILGKMDGVVGP